MKTIAIIAQKGGVGKTTLTCNLALTAKIYRKKPAVLDMDENQNSAATWIGLRKQEWPIAKTSTIPTVSKMLTILEKLKVDYTFIDTLPSSNEMAIKAAQVADFVVIPVGLSLNEMATVKKSVDIVTKLNKPAILVLSKAKPNKKAKAKKVMATLKAKFPTVPVSPVILWARDTYEWAEDSKMGLIERSAKSVAAQEIKDFYKVVERLLKEHHGTS